MELWSPVRNSCLWYVMLFCTCTLVELSSCNHCSCWCALVVSTADVNANCLILLPPTYRAAFAVALGCGYCCDADKLLMLMHLLFCSNCCFRIFSHRMELMFSYRGAVILFSVLALSSLNVLSFFHRCWTSNVGELYPLGAHLIFHRLFLFYVSWWQQFLLILYRWCNFSTMCCWWGSQAQPRLQFESATWCLVRCQLQWSKDKRVDGWWVS